MQIYPRNLVPRLSGAPDCASSRAASPGREGTTPPVAARDRTREARRKGRRVPESARGSPPPARRRSACSPAREASYPCPLRRPSPPGSRAAPARRPRCPRCAAPAPARIERPLPNRHRTEPHPREIRSAMPGTVIAPDIAPPTICPCELVAKSIPVWRSGCDVDLDLW